MIVLLLYTHYFPYKQQKALLRLEQSHRPTGLNLNLT